MCFSHLISLFALLIITSFFIYVLYFIASSSLCVTAVSPTLTCPANQVIFAIESVSFASPQSKRIQNFSLFLSFCFFLLTSLPVFVRFSLRFKILRNTFFSLSLSFCPFLSILLYLSVLSIYLSVYLTLTHSLTHSYRHLQSLCCQRMQSRGFTLRRSESLRRPQSLRRQHGVHHIRWSLPGCQQIAFRQVHLRRPITWQ